MAHESYGKHHQMFLQSMMCKQVAAGNEIKAMFVNCCEQSDIPIDLEEIPRDLVKFVKAINQSIQPFGMELKKGICELDGTNYYLLINTCENTTLGKLVSDYSQQELEFFHKLMEKILESEEGRISSTEALNFCDTAGITGRFSKVQVQELLERLAAHKWLNVDRNVSLGVHTLVELDEYLKRIYPDAITACTLCKLIVVNGQSCSHCFVKFHKHCLQRFFQGKENFSCPGCKGNWPHMDTLTQQGPAPKRVKRGASKK